MRCTTIGWPAATEHSIWCLMYLNGDKSVSVPRALSALLSMICNRLQYAVVQFAQLQIEILFKVGLV
jgi:hypothetical protein